MLDWSDGPRMTYTLLKPGGTTQYASDSLGGIWRYNASTGSEGFALDNVANGNRIVCAQAQDDGALYAITENGIGPVKLGMTLLEAKRAFPDAIFSRGSDGEGVALVNVSTKESLVMVLFANEGDRNKPIDWSRESHPLRHSRPVAQLDLVCAQGDWLQRPKSSMARFLKS